MTNDKKVEEKKGYEFNKVDKIPPFKKELSDDMQSVVDKIEEIAEGDIFEVALDSPKIAQNLQNKVNRLIRTGRIDGNVETAKRGCVVFFKRNKVETKTESKK